MHNNNNDNNLCPDLLYDVYECVYQCVISPPRTTPETRADIALLSSLFLYVAAVRDQRKKNYTTMVND